MGADYEEACKTICNLVITTLGAISDSTQTSN